MIEVLCATESQWKVELEEVKKKPIEYHTLIKHRKDLAKFSIKSYLKGMAECRARIPSLFLKLDLRHLGADKEPRQLKRKVERREPRPKRLPKLSLRSLL